MSDAACPVLLITRPRPAADRFAAQVAARFPGRFVPLVAPLMAIAARPVPPPPPGTDALIFTSENGARAFAGAFPGRDLPAFCVGGRTAQAAREAGFSTREARGTGADLARLVADVLPRGATLFHPRGAHRAADLPGALTGAGIAVTEAVVYDQQAVPLTEAARAALAGSAPVVAPLFSPRTARLFAGELGAAGSVRGPLTAVCLSPAVADALPAKVARTVAARPDGAAMLDALDTAI